METIITFIIWAAILQGLLLGVIFITTKKYKSFANKLLGCFMLAFVLQALTDILPFNQIGSYSIGSYFTLPEVKWLLPLLFLHFILEKLDRFKLYKRFMQIHYFLAFCMIGLTLINLALHFFWHTSLIDLVGWKLMDQMYMSLQYYAFLLSVVVFVIAFRETRRYSQLVKNEYSDLELLNINWLWQFIFLVIPMILFWGAELIRIALGGRGQSNLTIAVFLFIALFNYFVSYKAFTQHTLFEVTEPERDRGHNDKTYNTPREVPDQNVCQQIQQAMQTQEYFLDQNLTLHSFARQVQIPARTISSCVNQHAGFNFNEWVNNFRVDKALALINDENMQHLSIEGIGAEAGFKSRSAMYTAFKKKTGRSPGQFREI